MPTEEKATKPLGMKKARSAAGRGRSASEAAAAQRREAMRQVISPRQLKKVDELLNRIERKAEALSARTDRLLKSVS